MNLLFFFSSLSSLWLLVFFVFPFQLLFVSDACVALQRLNEKKLKLRKRFIFPFVTSAFCFPSPELVHSTWSASQFNVSSSKSWDSWGISIYGSIYSWIILSNVSKRLWDSTAQGFFHLGNLKTSLILRGSSRILVISFVVEDVTDPPRLCGILAKLPARIFSRERGDFFKLQYSVETELRGIKKKRRNSRLGWYIKN